MNGKPVIYRENARTALTTNSLEFQEKLLCDGLTMNLGDACAYSCEFCYVEGAMLKLDKALIDAHNEERGLDGTKALRFPDVVIRRRNAVELLRGQLLKGGRPGKFTASSDRRVVYSSTLVDVAANMDLLRETAEACNLILEHTGWQIRLLSKSSLLHLLVKDLLIPAKHHDRLILGFSTGTLDDSLAKAFETGTANVSKRIQSLHWLQDNGIRTFGMICPSLPQDDYDAFSREICGAIRVDRCEHVWAEVINLRGQSLIRTVAALRRTGLDGEGDRLEAVSGPENRTYWEEYARATFQAHTRNVSPSRLRFLQYITRANADWWVGQRNLGAVLLGSHAKTLKVTALDLSGSTTGSPGRSVVR